MSKEALMEIVANETADISDSNERLREAIEIALRLLSVELVPIEQ